MNNYACSLCSREFKRKFNYQRHENTCLQKFLKRRKYNRIIHRFNDQYRLVFWQDASIIDGRFLFWKEEGKPTVINMIKVKVPSQNENSRTMETG